MASFVLFRADTIILFFCKLTPTPQTQTDLLLSFTGNKKIFISYIQFASYLENDLTKTCLCLHRGNSSGVLLWPMREIQRHGSGAARAQFRGFV